MFYIMNVISTTLPAPLPAATCQQLSLPRIRSIASLFSLSSDAECFDETGGAKAPTGIY